MPSSSNLIALFRYKAWANVELLEVIESVDGDTHPNRKQLAIRILNHALVVDKIFYSHLTGAPQQFTSTNTIETPRLDVLSGQLRSQDEEYLHLVEILSGHELAEVIDFQFTDGETGRMTREEILLHVSLHGGYHRGQIGRVLAECSIVPPRDIFTRFLHSCEADRRKAELST